jgi:glycosyltransferase involved in cell wall biosynthesis
MSTRSTAGGPFAVAVECSRLAHDVRGIGRYVRALLPRLLAQRPALHLIPFARRRPELDAMRDALVSLGIDGERATPRLFAELRTRDADLYWYPWNVVRPAPRNEPVVATIHDAAPLAFPDPRWTKWRQNRRWRRLYEITAKRATLIITDAKFTAGELDRLLDVSADRIRVVPLAADDVRIPPPGRDADALARLGVQPPYVLAVSADDRRKNLALLERAMPHVADLLPDATLVTVGPSRADRPAGEPAWRRSLGFVTDDDLVSLYRGARALVVPSLYEGFGLPVLEAMQVGTPVICARTSSLPEVGGAAARYVNPTDEGQLALAIADLLTNDQAFDSARRAGMAQAARFSWDRTARLTLAAFDAALGR